MEILRIALIWATFLSSLVAGFLFAFAIVVMPGIRRLNNHNFIRAFQVMDRIIQNNPPIFIVVWAGSILALGTSVVLGLDLLDGTERLLLIVAALAYFFGVQLPTWLINIPLNNQLQTLDVDIISEHAQKEGRQLFERRWNLWNSIRTIFASLASLLLIILLFRF